MVESLLAPDGWLGKLDEWGGQTDRQAIIACGSQGRGFCALPKARVGGCPWWWEPLFSRCEDECPLPTPSLSSSGTCHGSPGLTLWMSVSALLTDVQEGEPLSFRASWMLAPGSHFKKLHVAVVPTVLSPYRFLTQSQSGSRRQRGGGREWSWSVGVRASPPFLFLVPKTS